MSPPPPPAAQPQSQSLPSASATPAIASLLADADAGEAEANAAAEAYERANVHGIYEAIAPHFSSTRYKPWPAVASYLKHQRPGAVGFDVGCGNGKYLGVNRSVYMVGSDRSLNLVRLAGGHVRGGGLAFISEVEAEARKSKKVPSPQSGKNKKKGGSGNNEVAKEEQKQYDEEEEKKTKQPAGATTADVLVADGLSLPFRDRSADFVICVAVIHHMSTRARRQDAIRQLLECVVLPPSEAAAAAAAADPDEIIARGGTVLVYVWALEQGSSRRGWDEGGEQDLLVPWVMKKSQAQAPGQGQGGKQGKKSGGGGGGSRSGNPTAVTAGSGGGGDAAVDKSGEPQQESSTADGVASTGAGGGNKEEEVKTSQAGTGTDPDPSTVFNRYYHLYKKGELEEDVLAAGGVVVKSGYERDNWWVVCAPKNQ